MYDDDLQWLLVWEVSVSPVCNARAGICMDYQKWTQKITMWVIEVFHSGLFNLATV